MRPKPLTLVPGRNVGYTEENNQKGGAALDVYYAEIALLRARQEEALALLPPQRRAKAAACRRVDDRLRSAAAGLLLVQILGRDAAENLVCVENGKPAVPGGPPFSLAHSGPFAVLAVGNCPLGVDIEAPRPVSPLLRRRCFSAAEQNWAGGDNGRYLRLWTRKESVMKATGRGVALSAGAIDTLGDTTDACGRVWFLRSSELDGCPLSAAAEQSFSLRLHRVDAAFLFRR